MRTNKEMPKCCRFCVQGNEKCTQRDEEIEKRFPVHRDGILAPIPEYDRMGIELNEKHKCFKPVFTGQEAKKKWIKKQLEN